MKPWTPRPYQLKAAQFMVERDAAGLFLRPGLGKTSTTLAALQAMRATGDPPALVIAPLRPVTKVWPPEVKKWTDFASTRVQVLHGPKKDQALRQDADLYVVNPEGLPWLFQAKNKPLPFEGGVLVVDESTRFKNPSRDRFKLLKSQLSRFSRRYILAGKPRPERLDDIWAQVYLLDGGERLGKYITHFRNRYMIDAAPRGVQWSDWRPRLGAEEEIAEKIADLVMVLGSEHLALPPLVTNTIEVDLPADARRNYREIERQFITELKSGTVSLTNAGAKAMKLRQIANGFVYDDAGVAHQVHTAKVDALKDLVDELQGDPLLVAVAFLPEAANLCKYFDAPYIGGGVSTKKADQIIDDWNDGKLPVLFAHPTSVAHGLNLQAGGRSVCWFGLTYSSDEYEQFIQRVHRQGQERECVVHHIVADMTIDQAILEALSEKDASERKFLNLLKRMYV